MNNRWSDEFNGNKDLKQIELENLINDAFPNYKDNNINSSKITISGTEVLATQLTENFNNSVNDSINYGMAIVLARLMYLDNTRDADMDDVMDLVFTFFIGV